MIPINRTIQKTFHEDLDSSGNIGPGKNKIAKFTFIPSSLSNLSSKESLLGEFSFPWPDIDTKISLSRSYSALNWLFEL